MLLIDLETLGITVSRGDFSSLRFSLLTGTEPYCLDFGDKVCFSVKKTPNDKNSLIALEAENPGESFVDIILSEGMLTPLPFGEYSYDIRLRFADGHLWTPPPFPAPFVVKEVIGNG